MQIESYDITILNGDDISLFGDKIEYATINDMYGLSIDCDRESEEYKEILALCDEIRNNFIELNKRLNHE